MFGFLNKDAFMSEQAVMERAGRNAVNYRVSGVSHFGSEPRGSVIPKWVAELSGSHAEQLVADGVLEETDEPVVKSFRAPIPKAENDPVPAMTEELDRLRRDNVRLTAHAQALGGENDEFRRERANQMRALGEQTAEVAHWRGAAEKHAERVAELETELELERATRPPAPEVKPDAPKKK